MVNNSETSVAGENCNNCKNSIEKLMCQAETQFESDCNLKQNDATQTSFSNSNLMMDKNSQSSEDENICPLCGVVYEKTISFDLFYEHVVNHFVKELAFKR